ncbi:MAG: hypothetical protein RQ767_00795 [Thermovirgaceae bacterium]|nr:hypothetical protein [Thermovirgaceae bacterium]
MEWTQAAGNPSLRLNIRPLLVPLPMLLQSLRILAVPAGELGSLLDEFAKDNPYLEVMPPSAVTSAFDRGTGWSLMEDISDPGDPGRDLSHQIAFLPGLASVPRRNIEMICDCLGPSGRLTCSARELAEIAGSGPESGEELLRALQDWVDPPGLFARDLSECLAIQLRRSKEEGSDAWLLITGASDLLEDGRAEEIKRRFGWSSQRLEMAVARLGRLDPFPDFSRDATPVVIPELLIKANERGVSVVLLKENLPGIRVKDISEDVADGSVFRRLRQQACGVEAEYRRRMETRLAVGLDLAQRQRKFLSGLEKAPGPCVLSDIAKALSLHPATVHRTTSRTWCSTPIGTISLGTLFSRPLNSRPDISVAQLRCAIRSSLLRGESAAALGRELNIPSRTVRWHRSRMGL